MDKKYIFDSKKPIKKIVRSQVTWLDYFAAISILLILLIRTATLPEIRANIVKNYIPRIQKILNQDSINSETSVIDSSVAPVDNN